MITPVNNKIDNKANFKGSAGTLVGLSKAFIKSQENLSSTRFIQDTVTNWVPKALFCLNANSGEGVGHSGSITNVSLQGPLLLRWVKRSHGVCTSLLGLPKYIRLSGLKNTINFPTFF